MAFNDKNLLQILSDLVKRVKTLEQTPVTRMVLPKSASAPASPIEGEVYYNTTTHKGQIRTDAAWVDLH